MHEEMIWKNSKEDEVRLNFKYHYYDTLWVMSKIIFLYRLAYFWVTDSEVVPLDYTISCRASLSPIYGKIYFMCKCKFRNWKCKECVLRWLLNGGKWYLAFSIATITTPATFVTFATFVAAQFTECIMN